MDSFIVSYYMINLMNLSVISAPVEFTDEEGYGKYLDLHECYEKYINLKGIEVSGLIHIIHR